MKNESFCDGSHLATIDGVAEEFEKRWQSGAVPAIEDFLARFPHQAELRKALLMELVAVDIEYQWQRPESAGGMNGERPLLDGYAARFPEFPPVAELPISLVRAEYRARRLNGDFPSLADYQRRFSARRESLAAALADVDAEISRPIAGGENSATGPAAIVPTTTISRAAFNLTRDRASNAGDSADLSQTGALPTVKRVGHFELVEPIGTEAFGSVYKARGTTLGGRTVAIKIPRKEQLSAADVEMFKREARVAAQLDHDNIVRVYEVGQDGETVFIATQLIRGVTLADWMTAKRPTERETAELGRKLALALHYAHEKRVIHRDFKPGNILVDQEGEPHITDFGLAKREVGEDSLNAQGPMGTPAYTSPEQARGDGGAVDRRTDVYSLGVVVFELLTGERPFRGSVSMVMHQVMTEDAPSPKKLNSNVSRDMETIVLKCLEREPKNRFSTAAELADELGRVLKKEPILSRPIGRVQRAWRWCRRNPAVAGLSAAVFALLLMVSVVLSMMVASLTKQMHEFSVWSSPEAETNPDAVINVGLYESFAYLDLHGQFKPFLEQLAKDFKSRTGKEVRIDTTIWHDYEDTIDKLVDGDVDLVRFGPASYVAARNRNSDIRLLAMELEQQDTKHTHESYIFVHKDSGIDEGQIRKLVGMKIAVTDPYSTSTIYIKSLLAEAGITSKEVEVVEFTKHDDVVAAVGNRVCDAGLVRYSVFNKGNVKFNGTLKRIGKVDVPNKPWLASSRLDPSHAAALRECLLNYKDKAAMERLNVSAFDSATRKEYDEVDRVLKNSAKFNDR